MTDVKLNVKIHACMYSGMYLPSLYSGWKISLKKQERLDSQWRIV